MKSKTNFKATEAIKFPSLVIDTETGTIILAQTSSYGFVVHVGDGEDHHTNLIIGAGIQGLTVSDYKVYNGEVTIYN